MTPQEALIARFAGSADPDEQDEWWTTVLGRHPATATVRSMPFGSSMMSHPATAEAAMTTPAPMQPCCADATGMPVPCQHRKRAAERTARQTPDTSGLREALSFIADWAHDCEDDDRVYGFEAIERMARAALAATERPLDVTTLVTDTATGDQWRVPTRAVEAIVAALDATKEAE